MIVAFLLAAATAQSSMLFKGFVQPHQAADGDRYEIVLAKPRDLTDDFQTCGIEDFAPVRAAVDETTYQFAVTRTTESKEACLKAHLPQDAHLDHEAQWIVDAKTD